MVSLTEAQARDDPMGEFRYHTALPGVRQTNEHTVLKFNEASRMEDEVDNAQQCDPCLKQRSCSRIEWKRWHPAFLNFCLQVVSRRWSGCTFGYFMVLGGRPF